MAKLNIVKIGDEIEETERKKAYDEKENKSSGTGHVVLIEFSGDDFLRHGEEFFYHIPKFFPESDRNRKKGSEMEKNGIDSGGFAAVSGEMLIKGKMSA
jgi:hypothetical protein